MVVKPTARLALGWVDPAGDPVERELASGSLTIGRASSNNLVLTDQNVSRDHARVDISDDQATVRDLNSRNGTFVNGERITAADLSPGDDISIGSTTFRVIGLEAQHAQQTVIDLDEPAAPDSPDRTITPERPAAPQSAQPAPMVERRPSIRGIVTEETLQRPVISERELADAGVEVKTAEFVALGGGMGTFVFVNLLRNSGVAASDILIVGNEEQPFGRYERLTRHSQIPRHERIRSNSESCPDNIWGFPGYAPREAWTAFKEGRLADAIRPLIAILGEPVLATTYTPKVGHVFESMEREARRIGWSEMHHRGRIRAIRKTEEGQLVAIVSASDEHQRRHFAVSGRFMQLAVGYPAIELLPDLAQYRETYERQGQSLAQGRELTRVVAAYEPHDHVYDHLRENGGTVLLRGRGIVASRVIQRLFEERKHNQNIIMVHLHRSRITKGHRFGLSRRVVDHQFEFQPFNWPKACWGGEYRDLLERSSDDERKRLLDAWGGTTTASRPDWRRIVRDGTNEGWYRAEFGVVKDVHPTPGGRVNTVVDSRLAGGGTLNLEADFVIDCTGLVGSPERAPFLADLYGTYRLAHNPKGRLQVRNDFEIAELRHETARLYAAGALTLGGPHAGVDTFLALQYCAVTSVHAMLQQHARGLRPLSGAYSFAQWRKWVKGVAP